MLHTGTQITQPAAVLGVRSNVVLNHNIVVNFITTASRLNVTLWYLTPTKQGATAQTKPTHALYVNALVSACGCDAAGVSAKVAQLDAVLQRQGQIDYQPDAHLRKGICCAADLQHLASELVRLDMQCSELKTQMQAESQAQQLLKRLSGTTGCHHCIPAVCPAASHICHHSILMK